MYRRPACFVFGVEDSGCADDGCVRVCVRVGGGRSARACTCSVQKSVIGAECERAVEQGLDPESQGFTIIIKKNGRIGQRIKGLPNYTRLIGDVEERKAKGMDVDNI